MLECAKDDFGNTLSCLFKENGEYFGIMLTLEIVFWLFIIAGIGSKLFRRNSSRKK